MQRSMQRRQGPASEQEERPGGLGPPAREAFERPPAQVRVIAGADVQDMDLAGRTVAEARAVAQAVFGIRGDAVATVDGRQADEDHVLAPAQVLVFVKHAGQKGAPAGRGVLGETAGGPVVQVAGDRASWGRGGPWLGTSTLGDLLARALGSGAPPTSWPLYPRQVRLMVERARGRVVGVVIEMPPGPRPVRWISADSPARYGARGRYQTRHLSFPWVVLLLVFVQGELSGLQQAFYRATAIGSLDDELLFTNLLNVARGYGQESWVCLANLQHKLRALSWEERIRSVTDHFWEAAFNLSSEAHEGNSYWGASKGLDARLASVEAWEEATRADPYFALNVAWPRAPHTVRQSLQGMLERVAPWRPIERAEHLVTLMQQEA